MNDYAQPLPGDIPLDMVFVRGNEASGDRDFMMGGSDKESYDNEKPVHPVRLSSFFIGKFPVTQAQWEAVLGAPPGPPDGGEKSAAPSPREGREGNPSHFKGERRPVERASWFDAAVFCNALSELSQNQPCYFDDAAFKKPYGKTGKGWELPNKGEVFINYEAGGYRLPTEAEWEYAARGGPYWEGEGYRYAGSDLLEQVGWYEKNSGSETRDVGLLLPNALGLCDMSGNVWEWCNDWYDADYYAKCKAQGTIKNPQGPEKGEYAVLRGGSWNYNDNNCRVAVRYRNYHNNRYYNLGFRLARAAGEGGM